MKMKKLILLLASLLVFTGCKYQVLGDLNVTDTLKLGKKTYQVGSYNASLGISRTVFTRRYKMHLNIESTRGKEIHKFKAPKGMNFPKNGHFTFTSSQLKQPYGLDGDVSTQYTDGPIRRKRELCDAGTISISCGMRTDSYEAEFCPRGERYVEYYIRTVDQDLSFDIVDDGNSVANFNGSYHGTYLVETWRGPCFAYDY